ncbi:MAG: serine--tRNA ligase [Candidatus Aenigmarchaeota archaeon]|nr:serine--tRNA ligase [Candidatus Aenigmarchaeota archaeon]
MLDIMMFREKPDVIRKSEKDRFKDPKTVDQVIDLDRKWRESLQKVEKLKQQRNEVTREIAELKKHKKPAGQKINEMKKVNDEIRKTDELTKELLSKRDILRYKVGNIIGKDVPVGNSEGQNKLIRFWGTPSLADASHSKEMPKGMKTRAMGFVPKSHVDMLVSMDLGDVEKAARVSGSRFYYLKNELVMLNLALIRFAMDTLSKEGFVPVWTPYMLNKEAIAAAAELSDFEEMLYKIQDEEMFLIATSEQTLAAYHMNEMFEESDLPKAYAGFSTNFRREAGAHGKDTKGIFRVHQFDKVEQYVFCRPEDSKEWFGKMIGNAEKIFRALEIPYRVMAICSGEMNDNAAIKYDLEAWMPAQGKFREVVSCSNCTDYQARKLGLRFTRNGEKIVPHTLNSTAVATERVLVAIMENFQQKDGSIRIPKALVPYTGFNTIKR